MPHSLVAPLTVLADDRFIIKELSKAELTVLATFAPAYFEYMAATISARVSTNVHEIGNSSIYPDDRSSGPHFWPRYLFGCYRISFMKPWDAKAGVKNKSTGTAFLVMENLFYDRRFTKVRLSQCVQICDLKGSTRNRHVHATGRENEVLLDENLVQS